MRGGTDREKTRGDTGTTTKSGEKSHEKQKAQNTNRPGDKEMGKQKSVTTTWANKKLVQTNCRVVN